MHIFRILCIIVQFLSFCCRLSLFDKNPLEKYLILFYNDDNKVCLYGEEINPFFPAFDGTKY